MLDNISVIILLVLWAAILIALRVLSAVNQLNINKEIDSVLNCLLVLSVIGLCIAVFLSSYEFCLGFLAFLLIQVLALLIELIILGINKVNRRIKMYKQNEEDLNIEINKFEDTMDKQDDVWFDEEGNLV